MAKAQTASSDLVPTWLQQSPVDLGMAIYAPNLPALTFDYNHLVSGHFESDENFKIDAPWLASVQYNGVTCPLVKLHFHDPSEHAVAGVRTPFEAHLVHLVPSIVESALPSYLVVGVFFDEPGPPKRSNRARPVVHASLAEAARSWWFKKSASRFSIRPEVLLPSTGRQNFYRYEGSLTTPPYGENVSWFVLKKHALLDTPIELTMEQATAHPPRPLQPLNRRFVLRNFNPA